MLIGFLLKWLLASELPWAPAHSRIGFLGYWVLNRKTLKLSYGKPVESSPKETILNRCLRSFNDYVILKKQMSWPKYLRFKYKLVCRNIVFRFLWSLDIILPFHRNYRIGKCPRLLAICHTLNYVVGNKWKFLHRTIFHA